jgi:branched-chain amino acid transport system ATP-binding protein
MLLEIEGVTKKFGGLTALDQVNLQVEEGEIVGVIGPNGAGKSTLLNIIAGVYRPTIGSVRFQGEKISGLSPDRICQRGIARTFQIPRPFSRMSVLENILVATSFGMHGAGSGKQSKQVTVQQAALEALEFAAFPLPVETPASSLNTAQLRRLDLARALAIHPRLLLLDETAAGLTPTELTELQSLIFKIRDQGTTVLIVEHLMRLIMQLCDRIMVLQYGVKIAEGSPVQIAGDEKVAVAYLGGDQLLTEA